VQLLAARERELQFGAALFVEIELERYERHALALDRAGELLDLAAVQQQLTDALGRVIEAPALQIFGDIRIHEPKLAAAGVRVRLRDRRPALPQRLDLGAGEGDPGLEHLADLVIEPRSAIVGDNLAIGFDGHPGLQQCASRGR
jgi:hypothetical protein